MKRDDAKFLVSNLNDLSVGYVETANALKATARVAEGTKKLWRDKRHPWLIKAGMALIAFPDPTISDIVGSAFVAAGLVQEGIRRRALHVDDVAKTFQQAMRGLNNHRDGI